jgi:hypothetical protein
MRVNSVRETRFLAALGLLATGLLGLGCEPGGVGDPCVPEDEYITNFSGFSEDQVNVESRSFQCLTRVCLVNHFQGRVSCPYGQTEETANLCKENPSRCAPGGDLYAQSCRLPGQDGSDASDQITVPVLPQRVERTANRAVYCSCRCAGPDPNANYCECPSGFQCTELVDNLGIGRGQLAGSYCIKNGTRFDEDASPGPTCSPADGGNCGNGGANPPEAE